ncbi:LacI family DNA-binding transcriptional regulator [Schaalia sp. ZJ405]|uniref:LacI family DNA-binding transcriptional regulator n=1 Tax=Schaalia sp. ZJ405 TaxID=2709403 RepID=UPI0018CA3F5A|nr:LacI family DNA-binding transcriptional regulator [Schaalia sp. ZJ405]QPK81642.1 LacI family DNA-binding transcriptional regulator [Schaalia sp. ZJ405]
MAKAAAVSPATVSRVLNGTKVRADLEERVREATKALGYVPSRLATALRTRNSRLIALCIPDLSNPFFIAMASAVQRTVVEAGYSLVLFEVVPGSDEELRCFQTIIAEQMAGVITVPSHDPTRIQGLLHADISVVAVDRSGNGLDIDCFLIANEQEGYDCTNRLFDVGYHHVACISGPVGVETADHRVAGWMRAVSERVDESHAQRVVRAAYTVAAGRRAFNELIEKYPDTDAVFVANNLLSVGVIQAVISGNSHRNFGILAFGSVPYMLADLPTIQVAHLPARQIGSGAATRLLERIHGSKEAPERIIYATTVNWNLTSAEDLIEERAELGAESDFSAS